MIPHYVVLVLLILLMALVPFRSADVLEDDVDPLEVVPHCSNECQTVAATKPNFLNLVITTTLDGTITALDGETGQLVWRHEDDALLKGTLANSGPIDVGGSRLQLLPTLDGRLFSFSLQSNLIEPLPITTDTLLESTVRLGRDAVAGGKSVSTTGLNIITGDVKYKCTLDSCENNEDSSFDTFPTLLVKRVSNTIRALDSSRGTERWNLSTAEVTLSLATADYNSEIKSSTRFLLRPPDGVVHAVSRYNDEEWSAEVGGHIVGVWHVLDNSIKEISIFDPTNIYTTQREVGFRRNMQRSIDPSLLYMGTSNGYPFIIQSEKSKQTLKTKMRNEMDMTNLVGEVKSCSAPSTSTNQLGYEVEETALLSVLREAFRKSHSKMIEDTPEAGNGRLTIVAHNTDPEVKMTCLGPRKAGVAMIGSENLRSTALMSGGDRGYLILDTQNYLENKKLHPLPVKVIEVMENISSYVGHLLGWISAGLVAAYSMYHHLNRSRQQRAIERLSSQESEESSTRERTTSYVQTDDDHFVVDQFHDINCDGQQNDSRPEDSENWQKDEILSLSTSKSPLKVTSILKTNNAGASPFRTPIARRSKANSEVKTDFSESDDHGDSLDNSEKRLLLRNRTISRSSIETFRSRFAEEYEVQKVIGHGGFGVVFRAKSKMDTIEYAVKRIAVADNVKARERVCREAIALATFDHPGIIRYFTTWEERPPKGFQEREDENVLGKMKADKLKKLRSVKKRKNMGVSKSSTKKSITNATCSFADSFEMPPIVEAQENTENEKPKQLTGTKRSTDETKRGLYADTPSAEELSFGNQASSDSSSSSDDDSSSDSDDEECEHEITSSTGGIEFVADDDDDMGKKLSAINDMSLQNRAILDATENNEIELLELNEPRECAYLYIVMQLCDEKTLQHWIKKNSSIESRPILMMKQWIRQLTEALKYLHGKGFIHRDLKPGNVLFSLESKSNNYILKIGDLGLATKSNGVPKTNRIQVHSDAKHTKNVGTRSYMSPEQIENKSYTEKVDIFALGLVATELLIPFSTIMERNQTFSSYQQGIEPTILKEHADSREFLIYLTNLDSSLRPSAQEVLEHPFLN